MRLIKNLIIVFKPTSISEVVPRLLLIISLVIVVITINLATLGTWQYTMGLAFFSFGVAAPTLQIIIQAIPKLKYSSRQQELW